MKHTRKLLALLLTLATLLTTLPMTALAVEAEPEAPAVSVVETIVPALQSAPATATSGKVGNLSWSLSGTKLTISGKGALPDKGVPLSSSQQFSVTSVEIKSGVTSIGASAFFDYFALTSVSIPNTVTSIGEDAFFGCNSLKKISIPASVTKIGDTAFALCDSLTGFDVNGNNKNFSSPGGVLYNKNRTILIAYPTGKKGAYTIPNGVTEIGKCAFWECEGLTGITIPNTVKTIGLMAFSDCSGLTSVTIPSSVTKVELSAFSDCPKLTSVTVQSKTLDLSGSSVGRAYLNGKTQAIPGFVLYGYSGSAAQTYAKNNSLTFKTIGSGQSGQSTNLATPSITKLESASGGVIITWGKVSGAAKYRVFRKTGNGGWERIADVTDTRAVDRTAKKGTTYTYTVRCISSDSKTYTSSFNTTGWSIKYATGAAAATNLATPTITSLQNASGGVIINWGKVNGAVKYRVFRKTGNGGWERVADVTDTRAVDRTAKKGVTYTYTVRCISSDSKTYTSSFNTTGWSIKR